MGPETVKSLVGLVPSAVTLVCWLLAGVALWRGGGPERACALTIWAMLTIDDVYHLITGPYFPLDYVDPWHAFVDFAPFVALMVIAVYANRFYPLVLAAAQLVAVTTHIVRALVPDISGLSYWLLYTTPMYFQLMVLAGGMWRHYRRLERTGPYRDWRAGRPAAQPAGYGFS